MSEIGWTSYTARTIYELNLAKEKLSEKTEPSLRYCALHIRFAIEALAFERLDAWSDELPASLFITMQPRRIIQLLTQHDPSSNSTIRVSVQTVEPTTGDDGFRLLGTQLPLSMELVNKHYNSMGSFLHAPTLKQQKEDSASTEDAMITRCEKAIEDIDAIIDGGIWNYKFGNKVTITCMRCSKTVFRTIPQEFGEGNLVAWCECEAQYDVTVSGDELEWSACGKKASCLNEDCDEEKFVWSDWIKRDVVWNCKKCNQKHAFRLCLVPELEQQS